MLDPAIESELSRLRNLRGVGAALFEYAASLLPGSRYVKKQRRWVLEPQPNYITLTVQHARAQSILVTLYGQPRNFGHFPELPLKPERSGYWSKFTIQRPAQLAAATAYIRQGSNFMNNAIVEQELPNKRVESDSLRRRFAPPPLAAHAQR